MEKVVKPPDEYDFVPESWPKWSNRFKRYMNISGNEGRPDKEKINLLLYVMGEKAEQLIKQLKLQNSDSYAQVFDEFDKYFTPKRNIVFERAKFNNRMQLEGEKFRDFVQDLFALAENCEYDILKEGLIRDRIIVGICDKKLSERMQLMPNIKLEEAIRMAEQAEQQREEAQNLYEKEAIRNVINRVEINKSNKKKCSRCGRWGLHGPREQCPAMERECYKCHKIGHYGKCCMSKDWKRVNRVETPGENDFQLDVEVSIAGQKGYHKFLIDTGADVVGIPRSLCPKSTHIEKAQEIIKGPDGKPLQVIGSIWVELKHKQYCYRGKAYVLNNLQAPILGKPAIRKLKILKLCYTQLQESSVNVEKEYPKIFDQLGVFKDIFDIKIVKNPVPYVQTTPRVVPIPLLNKVKDELNKLVEMGVLSPVEEPTMFVSPIVVVPKQNGGVRICGDYTEVNKNIVRPIFPIPKVETTLGRLKGAKVFSKIDATAGFYQIRLSEESKKLTTILTPFGRFMYNRLPMGLNCAPEYFSMKFSQLFSDLEGVVVHVDDVLLYTQDSNSHQKLLREVLNRLAREGLTINKEKCVFNVNKIHYLGHVITTEGISLDPGRVESINQFRTPSNKKELMQFLGLVNYVGRFLPNKTEILHPLNELLKDGVLFQWDVAQNQAFNTIKSMIQNAPTLGHYDPSKKIIVSADSSSYGLGAVLMQEDKAGNREVVSYASRTLNSSEKAYAQIEKECLALAWAVHRFRDFVVGVQVTLESDHKPLLSILQTKPIDQLTPRLLRFRLQLMRYNYNVVYVPGKKLVVADALSRAPLAHTEDIQREYSIHSLIESKLTDTRLVRIKEEQGNCKVCQLISLFTVNGWPQKNKIPKEVTDYYQYRHHFTVQDGFLLYNTRLVVPQSLQKEILENIHHGHLGITKCREHARQSVWWLGLSSQIKLVVYNCPQCVQERQNIREPIVLEKIPDRAWQRIGLDLFKYEGCWYLVIIDYYSRYIELFRLTDLTESSIIKCCKETFSRFGIPEIVRTDCGTQFKSKFLEFAKQYNFVHITSSPYWAQSNGCAEAGVKIAKNLLKKNKDIHLALLIYRNTPLETGYSPNELMFSRKLRDNLPTFPGKYAIQEKVNEQFKIKREGVRKKMAQNYNNRHRVIKLPDLLVGDRVWVIDLRKYGTIVRKAKEPRAYFVQVERTNYRRNRWHLVPAPYCDYSKCNQECELMYVPDDRILYNQSRTENLVNDNVNEEDNNQAEREIRERPRRTIQRPQYLNDYVV